MSTLGCPWSVLRYDLKTALDVLGLPSLVKLADDYSAELKTGSLLKFKKEVTVPFVRARVLEWHDLDWYVFTKGAESTQNRRRFVDTEILIPLGYGGKIRLSERKGGKEYFNIRDVIEDFPRFVRVEKDTVCASPGVLTAQIVRTGTVLELDRVTKGMKVTRGLRESYLICLDKKESRELAFKTMAPIHFTKLPDRTKYILQYFVEHLPLPQTVEFVNINPYDVVTVDDDDANDLLVMLSGPVELIGVTMENVITGLVETPESERNGMIAVSADSELIDNANVFIPAMCIDGYASTIPDRAGDNNQGVTNGMDPGCVNCDILHSKLYLQYALSREPLMLKCNLPKEIEYNIEEIPDTPPVPRKHDPFSLTCTLSAQNVAATAGSEDGVPIHGKKKCLSTGDMKEHTRPSSVLSTEQEARGIRRYLSRLTQKVTSSASHVLFGIESSQGSDVFDDTPAANNSDNIKDKPSFRERRRRSCRPPNTDDGFICYINCIDSDSNGSIKTRPEATKTKHVESTKMAAAKDSCEEIDYALIDWSKITSTSPNKVFPCDICRLINKEMGLMS